MKNNKTKTFLISYLDALGIKGYEVQETEDSLGLLLTLTIPKANNEKIGVLKGKQGKNLNALKHLLRVIGFLEKSRIMLLVRLVDEPIA